MINNIVLDSNAFFKGNHLLELVKDSAPHTTTSVLNELRDQKTRQLLESFPFKIEVREPSRESVKFVRAFAVATGDSASLADTDIEVIALARDLIEKIGMLDQLNKHPKQMEVAKTNEDDHDGDYDNELGKREPISSEPVEAIGMKEVKQALDDIEKKERTQPFESVKEEASEKKPLTKQDVKEQSQRPKSPEGASVDEDDGWIQVQPKKRRIIKTKESGLNGWVTPSNYQQKKQKGLLNIEQRQVSIPQSNIPVWLITGDFAMQNVAMQIGIPTKSSDGMQIFSLKRYVQMCYACGRTIKDNAQQIRTCDKCGYNTLSKVAYTIDQAGNLVLHKKKGWVPNKQVFEWKQKKIEEQAKHSRNQRKRKVKSIFDYGV